MDRYDKWEMHYNRYYMPFHAESANTSRYRFGVPQHDLAGFEHGFAGRYGTSTTYAAPEEFSPYQGDGDGYEPEPASLIMRTTLTR